MINIDIKRKNRRVVISVKGHAAAAPKGEDLVCAAVSTLVLTLHETLLRTKAQGHEYRLTEGDALITFKQDKWTKPYMYTIMCGFDFLANAYPQYIKLRVEE